MELKNCHNTVALIRCAKAHLFHAPHPTWILCGDVFQTPQSVSGLRYYHNAISRFCKRIFLRKRGVPFNIPALFFLCILMRFLEEVHKDNRFDISGRINFLADFGTDIFFNCTFTIV